MSHALETLANGNASMMYVGETPWHKLGVKLNAPPTIEEGIVSAGLDWTVDCKPLFTAEGTQVTHRAIYRTSDNSILGVVGPDYRPLQNVEAFNWFQPLLSTGEVELHTAGSLNNGRDIWVLGKINRKSMEIVPGDSIEKFVLLSNSHGLRAVRVGFTPIRVVCQNTLSAAHSDAASKLIRCRHCSNVVRSLDALREVMNIADSAFEETAEQYRALARKKISRSDLHTYVRQVLGFGETEELATRTQNTIAKIESFYENGRGNALEGVKGTLWAGYNAVTEYLSYERGRTVDTRLESLWFGDSARVNDRAMEIALALAV